MPNICNAANAYSFFQGSFIYLSLLASRVASAYNNSMDQTKPIHTTEKKPDEIIEGEHVVSTHANHVTDSGINHYSTFLLKAFEENRKRQGERGMAVNPIASELAAWYEKLRTAIENRDEEVILRSAIERIIRRRLILGGNGKTVARPLIRELIWARYFPDESIGDDKVKEVETTIDLYLQLRNLVPLHNKVGDRELNEWIYQLMASDLEDKLSPTPKKEAMISYIFHNISRMVTIKDDTEEVRDVQVFIAIRKAYAKEDLPFLRYNLFRQYFGDLTSNSIEDIGKRFSEGKKMIDKQLNYKSRAKIFEFVKRQIPPFLILDDIMMKYEGKFRGLIANEEEFTQVITETCDARYANISGKVRRAIIRSIIFILLSKVFLALTVEGTYDRFVYGHILWHVVALNIGIPVAMMIVISFFMKAPGKDNTQRIVNRIKSVIFDGDPQLGRPLIFSTKPKTRSFLDTIFTIVWLGTYAISFGLIIYILSRLDFNPVSQGLFIFFFAIITFLSYRISQTANLYTVKDRSSLATPFIDFFFMPIARVGRYLAEGVQSVNIFIFVLDMLIETPLKGLIAFFEQWFFFLHSKREDLA